MESLRLCVPGVFVSGARFVACALVFLTCNSVLAQPSAPVFLDQGWSAEIRDKFYFTPQGSRLMPYSWFRALERVDGTDLFADPVNLAAFGWLVPPEDLGLLNPDGLPVGFVPDPAEMPGTGRWVGLNCAACHTGELTFQGKRVRIDGGQGTADLGRFLAELSRAVSANSPNIDKEKFSRFVARVLGPDITEPREHQLADAYLEFSVRFAGRVWMRTPPLPAGPGRVDALTQTLNALAVVNLGIPDNLRPPAAPTSYPSLWLTPRLDWVQWNPIASDPIARNTSEVLAVFGEANFGLAAGLRFSSSVLFKNLFDLEQWVDDLKPPRWPETILGPIDEARWRKGAEHFRKDCRSCHNMPPFDMTASQENFAGKQFIKIMRVDHEAVGTDPLYIEVLASRFAETGMLADTLFKGQKVVPAVQLFMGTVRATVDQGLADLHLSDSERVAYSGYRFSPPSSPGDKPRPYSPPSLTGLKAGPLLGVWATGPFLHNGSVPNLDELLSPPERRSKVFWVGNRELDNQKLGFISTEAPARFMFDTRLPGNSNTGHKYPEKPYTEKERRELIEYLKDPERFKDESRQGNLLAK
jgi:hypothetical protein